MLAAGNLLGGRYRLKRVLGAGGMGVVWAAVNEAFGREVAIKVLLPEVAEKEPQAVDRFFNEARICGSLRHPGIVDMIDVGRADDGAPFLVMELLDGAPLDAVMQRAGPLKPIEILPIVRDVARTLSLAHARGVVHRDIKPANLFLHQIPSGPVIAKVLDFGISKMTVSLGAMVKTRTGMIVGSPAYMSPEQALSNIELDGRSDVHALGVILYEALSGRLPFEDENYNTLVINIATKDPPPLASLSPGLPKSVLELVKAAMARDRDARIPSALALAERIEATLSALGVSPTTPVASAAALAGSPRASRDDEEARHVGFARTQDVTQNRATGRGTWLALAAGGLLLGGVAALAVWRFHASGPVAPEPARGDMASPVAAITVAPTAVSSGAASVPVVVTAAPSDSAAAPGAPRSTSAPRSAAPAPSLPAKKKKDVWGYD